MAVTKGGGLYSTVVLDSYLPYVLGHAGWPHGADWIYEAKDPPFADVKADWFSPH